MSRGVKNPLLTFAVNESWVTVDVQVFVCQEEHETLIRGGGGGNKPARSGFPGGKPPEFQIHSTAVFRA